MNSLNYLFEANLYLSVLYLFYRFVLAQETFYQLNRWYLIGILLISFSLPLVSIQNSSLETNGTLLNRINTSVRPADQLKTTIYNASPKEKEPVSVSVIDHVEMALMLVYGIGVLIGLFRLLYSVRTLFALVKRSLKYKEASVIRVRLQGHRETFSFFNWLFCDPELQPENAIISHEMVHIRQKHSIDVLLFELCKAFNWFNPLVYLLCKDVKLNHEFLADQEACQIGINKFAYALLLIDHTDKKPALPLTSAISSKDQLKQRLINLKKNRSGNSHLIKYTLALPLLILVFAIAAFTTPKTYGLITFKLPVGQQVLHNQNPFAGLQNQHVSDLQLKFDKALSPDHLQDRGKKSRKKQRKAAREAVLIALGQNGQTGSVVTTPLNNSNQEQLMTINRSKTDTAHVLAVKTVYKNGQVNMNRLPADTTLNQFLVEPVYKDGQVSINKRKVDP